MYYALLPSQSSNHFLGDMMVEGHFIIQHSYVQKPGIEKWMVSYSIPTMWKNLIGMPEMI